MKQIIKEYWELLLTLIVVVGCIMFMCCGCRGAEKIEYVTKTEYVHDTMTEYVHDTTKTTEVRIDSVDRLVEKTIYVDSNGVVHEKEVEKLTKYIYDLKDAYSSYEHVMQERIDKLKEELEQKKETKIIEKKVYVWWPCWVVLGIATLLGLWWLIEHGINKMAKKEGEE